MGINTPLTSGDGHSTVRWNTVLIVTQTVGLLAIAAALFLQNWRTEMFTIDTLQVVRVGVISLSKGESPLVETDKCNRTDEILSLGGATYWIREKPYWQSILSNYIDPDVGVGFPPGCIHKVYPNEPPKGVTPGTWRISGTNTVKNSRGQTETKAWETVPFEVVP